MHQPALSLVQEFLKDKKYAFPPKKLSGLLSGTVDCGSSAARTLNKAGERVSLSGDDLDSYLAIAKQKTLSEEQAIEGIRLALSFASQHNDIHIIQLGSAFQAHEQAIAKAFSCRVINESHDASVRFAEARRHAPEFGNDFSVIPVIGGGTSYHPDVIHKPINDIHDLASWKNLWDKVYHAALAQADAVRAADPKKSMEVWKDAFQKNATVVFQSVMAQMLIEPMTLALFEKANIQIKAQLEGAFLYQTSGGSNPGFGLQYPREDQTPYALEITLQKAKVQAAANMLGEALLKHGAAKQAKPLTSWEKTSGALSKFFAWLASPFVALRNRLFKSRPKGSGLQGVIAKALAASVNTAMIDTRIRTVAVPLPDAPCCAIVSSPTRTLSPSAQSAFKKHPTPPSRQESSVLTMNAGNTAKKRRTTNFLRTSQL